MTNYNSQYINPISRATMDASMEQLLVPCPPYVWPVVSSGGQHGTVAGPLSSICLTRGQFWGPTWNSCWSPVHHVSDPWSVLEASMEQLLVPCPPCVWPVVSSGGQHDVMCNKTWNWTLSDHYRGTKKISFDFFWHWTILYKCVKQCR